MFDEWFIFNHKPGMKIPDETIIRKMFYISLAITGITELFMAMANYGYNRDWSQGGPDESGYYIFYFAWDLRSGVLYMLLIVFFYLILLRGVRFVTQKSDPTGLETKFLITKMMQISIIKSVLYMLYYLIAFIFSEVEQHVTYSNQPELPTIHGVLHAIAFILSVLYLIPLIKKRIEPNYTDYNKLLGASTFASILVFSVLFTLNYTVIRILVELPLGI